jgi:hypothetical protein
MLCACKLSRADVLQLQTYLGGCEEGDVLAPLPYVVVDL